MRWHIDGDADAPAAGRRLAQFDDMLEHLLQLKFLALQHYLAAGDARHVEQVIHQPRQVRHLALDHVAHLADLLRCGKQVLEQGHRRLDGRQRIAQFMPEAGNEFILAPLRLAYLVLALARAQHGVGRSDQGQYVHGAFQQGQVAQGGNGLPQGQGIEPRVRQHGNRQVGPIRLLACIGVEHGVDAGVQGLVHRQHAAGAQRQLFGQFAGRAAGVAGDGAACQYRAGQGGILAGRRIDQDAQLHGVPREMACRRWWASPTGCRENRPGPGRCARLAG
ncbi:hypothetical protein D3C72_1146390 [compost metagenome]